MRFFGYARLAAAALALGVFFTLSGCGGQKTSGVSDSSTLKIGVIPFEQADAIQKGFKPFANYFAAKAGIQNSEVVVTPAYSGVLTALQSDQIDMAYLSPLAYALACEQFKSTPEKIVPLGMPYFHKTLTYKGIIFVRADSPIHSLKDLKGKSFAFADRTSASGYLYPAGMLREAGIDPEKDVKAVNIGGSASVLAVYNGQADAGAIYEGGIQLAFTDKVTKIMDTSKVKQFRILAYTDPIPNGMIVTRANIGDAAIKKLQHAIAVMNTDPQGKAALASIPDGGWDKMVPPDDSIFNSVRSKATILGLTLSALDAKKNK
jgi:phosphonate transport system substrate-binding protein